MLTMLAVDVVNTDVSNEHLLDANIGFRISVLKCMSLIGVYGSLCSYARYLLLKPLRSCCSHAYEWLRCCTILQLPRPGPSATANSILLPSRLEWRVRLRSRSEFQQPNPCSSVQETRRSLFVFLYKTKNKDSAVLLFHVYDMPLNSPAA